MAPAIRPAGSPGRPAGAATEPGEAPRVEPKSSTKGRLKSRTRSRSGCVTCKSRHSRCDETKPACNTCVRRGLTCGGYQRELRWSFKHEKTLKATTANRPPGNIVTTEIADEGEGDEASVWTQTPFATSQVIGDIELPFIVEPASSSLSGGDSPTASALESLDLFELSPTKLTDGNFSPCLELQPNTSSSAMKSFEAFMAVERLASDNQFLTNRNWYDLRSSINSRTDSLSQLFVSIPPVINDMPSLLINNWFDNVCAVWSAYDSHINLNRQLAGSLWFKSKAVSSCLQFMSVALMAEHMPQMKPEVTRYVQTAMRFIQTELTDIKDVSYFDSVPSSLLLSLCCIGTTLCWIDARQLGLPFLRETKALLNRLNTQMSNFSREDCNLLLFFNNSFIYWDMLSTVVSYNSELEPELKEELSGASKPIGDVAGNQASAIMPHPWTGISSVAPELFTSAIKLCRSFRRSTRSGMATARNLNNALLAIEKAKKIEEQLLGMELPLMTQLSETGDELTPRKHLLETAEAYRLASLLQIYQTFPDLVAIRLPAESFAPLDRDGHVPWDKWIVPLSLRLIKLLKEIPASSGSRVIQPLLYISAGTGLKYERPQHTISRPGGDVGIFSSVPHENRNLSGYIDQFLGLQAEYGPEDSLSPLALSIGSARRFVMDRLNILESSLPPKPIGMAKRLVKAVWAAYDEEPSGSTQVHWIDVMEDQELRTLLG